MTVPEPGSHVVGCLGEDSAVLYRICNEGLLETTLTGFAVFVFPSHYFVFYFVIFNCDKIHIT